MSEMRRSSGEARRSKMGLALVLLLVVEAGSHSVSGASAVRVGSGVAGLQRESFPQENGLRSLQEETPVPTPVTEDTVEAPTPDTSVGTPETPGPTPAEDAVEVPTPETPGPAPAEDTVEVPTPETPGPAPAEDTVEAPAPETPGPTPAEDTVEAPTPETPGPAPAEDTVEAPAPETPGPTPAEDTVEVPTPETPGPTPAEDTVEVPTPETPGPTPPEDTVEVPTPETPGPTPVGDTVEAPTPETPVPAPVGDTVETPTPGASETPVSSSPVAGGTGSPTPGTEPEPTGTPAPFAPSTCANGIPGVSSGTVCCKEECGQCGGVGCGAIAGTNGASDCCPDTIIEEANGLVCGEAPCVMEGFTPAPVNPAFVGTASPVAPSTCSNGIPGQQDGAVCCAESCGTCGGDGCGTIPGTGGAAYCCPSTILESGVICGEAPCIIEGFTPAPAVVGGGTPAPFGNSTCSNGLAGYQDGAACCAANCGQCGGAGCGAVAGTTGASACCSTNIEASGQFCNTTGASPCIIEGYTPSPVVPDYGSAAPVVPSTCSNGLPGYQDNDICCLEACGVCGGAGCGTIPGTGGSSFCCPATIREAGLYCGNGVEAPCIIGEWTPSPVNPALEGTASPVVPTTCSNGLPGFQNGAACCKESCGQCGGVGCGTIPGTGGASNCCATNVLESNIICGNGVEAPCVIENYTPAPMGVPGDLQPFAPSMCTNGLAGVQDENICCAENCGQCGGIGCGTVPGTGGSGSCCSGTIAVNGSDCAQTMEAPCIISDWARTPSPTVFESAAPVVPSTCSNGLPGYQDGQACCLMNCGQCGGVGCGNITGTAGASDCCPGTILASNNTCGGGVVAPCVLAATPSPTPTPVVTTDTPFVAGNANDFVNTTSAAEPRTQRAGLGMMMPLATAAAAFLGALALSAHRAA